MNFAVVRLHPRPGRRHLDHPDRRVRGRLVSARSRSARSPAPVATRRCGWPPRSPWSSPPSSCSPAARLLRRAARISWCGRRCSRRGTPAPRRAGHVGQAGELRPGPLGVAAHGLPGPLDRRRLAQQAERLGVQRVVGDRPRSSSSRSRTEAASGVGGQRVEHRQGRHALAQVGAGRLAGLGRVARRCRAGRRRAGRRPRSSRRSRRAPRLRRGRAAEHRAEPGRGSDQRAGLVGDHPQVVVDRVGSARADGLRDLPVHQPGEGARLDPDRLRARGRRRCRRPARTGSRRSGSRSSCPSGRWRSARRGAPAPRPSRRRGRAWPGGSAR